MESEGFSKGTVFWPDSKQDLLISASSSLLIAYLDRLQKLKIEIINEDEHFLEFDMIGIDCSIANSFRRIMLAEVSSLDVRPLLCGV